MVARQVLLVGLVLTGIALGSQASNAGAAEPCFNGVAVECQDIYVPLDRAGSVPGSVRVYAERIGEDARRPQAVVYLAGGPGQAATPDLRQFATAVEPVLDRADIISFDQRGTGRSGRLSCPGLDTAIGPGAAANCAAKLGAAASSYRTLDSVADLDRVLDAFGVQKAVLYGVSYGTKVALQYAAAHPGRVTRMVLDSPVMPEGRDALGVSTLAAAGRVLRTVCASGRCRGITSDPTADLARLITRWGGRPALGRFVDSRGRVSARAISSADLLNVILAEDFDIGSRAALPGPIRAAVDGDLAPLIRLVRDALRRIAPSGGSGHNSPATNLVTLCSETAMPWAAAAAPLSRRRMGAATRVRTLGSRRLSPFDAAAVLDTFLIRACSGWPNTVPAVESVRLPDIPTLVVSGEQDVRTPIEDARSLVARLPRAQLVAVPGAGHSVVGTDTSGCALRAVLAFLAERAAGTRCAGARPVPVSPVPPRRLTDLPAGSSARRLVNAVAMTIADALKHRHTLIPESDRSPGSTSRAASGGGLRGGWVRRDGSRIELHAVQYIEHVRVTGTVDLSKARSKLAVRAPGGMPGVVSFRPGNGDVVLRTPDGTARARVFRGNASVR